MALNILVVDDSAVARTMIVRTLGMAGLDLGDVVQAANGAEGLAQLEDHWVDLIITDVNMPVMTGEEMVDHLRDNPAWADIPLLVVSTEGSQTRIDRLISHGAKFIHKPFTPEAIHGAVVEMIGELA